MELMHVVSKCQTEIDFAMAQEATQTKNLAALKQSIKEEEEKIKL